jgi:hypothetical protein
MIGSWGCCESSECAGFLLEGTGIWLWFIRLPYSSSIIPATGGFIETTVSTQYRRN